MITLLAFIILLSCFNALVINGLHKAFHYEVYHYAGGAEGVEQIDLPNSGVLGWLHFRYRNKIWAKPVFACATCMASFHSLYIYWPVMVLVFGFSWVMLPIYLLYIPATAAISSVIHSLS